MDAGTKYVPNVAALGAELPWRIQRRFLHYLPPGTHLHLDGYTTEDVIRLLGVSQYGYNQFGNKLKSQLQ